MSDSDSNSNSNSNVNLPLVRADLDPGVRKAETRAFSGYGESEFHEAIRTGEFPEPDGYLGPRSPFWLRSTLKRWQVELLARPKPRRVKVGAVAA